VSCIILASMRDKVSGEISEKSLMWNGRSNLCSFIIGQGGPLPCKMKWEGGEVKNEWEMEGKEEKEKKREEAAAKRGVE
jgi:hypothetical protein